jgi:hypothetical protein
MTVQRAKQTLPTRAKPEKVKDVKQSPCLLSGSQSLKIALYALLMPRLPFYCFKPLSTKPRRHSFAAFMGA